MSLSSSLAGAQTRAASSTEAVGLEEVVVTARKREETLIETPVSVSVLTGADIDAKGVRDLYDVALFTPGLTYFDALQNQLGTPVIRGISQTNLNSPDRNVAVFYGGVYLSNLSATNLELLDLERIEVVKGPQSALYGRNAFNGAINYVPASPTDEFTGKVVATLGSDNRQEARVVLSGPLSETLRGRVRQAITSPTVAGVTTPNRTPGSAATTPRTCRPLWTGNRPMLSWRSSSPITRMICATRPRRTSSLPSTAGRPVGLCLHTAETYRTRIIWLPILTRSRFHARLPWPLSISVTTSAA